MSSSTSSSDPAVWRGFFRRVVAVAAGGCALIFAFVATVDPYAVLPLSPPAERVPVDGNQRFSYPALARSQRFDSAIIGTSTSRLLRPATLDPLFHARFANLSMNAATAYEQRRMTELFVRHHPNMRMALLGVDIAWCGLMDSAPKYTERPFPEWMYDEPGFGGYGRIFNIDVVGKAGQAFAIWAGWKRARFGRDGYASFVPDDRLYDPTRVAMKLREAEAKQTFQEGSGDPAAWRYAALDELPRLLETLPRQARKVLFFPPLNHVQIPQAGLGRAMWDECKRRVVAAAGQVQDASVVDFMFLSPITSEDDNYWDDLHYRVGIAERLAHDLAAAANGQPGQDYRLLKGEALRAEAQ